MMPKKLAESRARLELGESHRHAAEHGNVEPLALPPRGVDRSSIDGSPSNARNRANVPRAPVLGQALHVRIDRSIRFGADRGRHGAPLRAHLLPQLPADRIRREK